LCVNLIDYGFVTFRHGDAAPECPTVAISLPGGYQARGAAGRDTIPQTP
jgi:hypothetical protein